MLSAVSNIMLWIITNFLGRLKTGEISHFFLYFLSLSWASYKYCNPFWALQRWVLYDLKVLTYVEYRAVSGVFHNIDPPPRVSFETSFDSKQPKLVSALSELFRLFRFHAEIASFCVSIKPKQTEDQPKQFEREHILVLFFVKCILLSYVGKINIIERKPRKNCSLGKNPLKYTTANIVQQSNCRWHCERSCLLG